MPQKVGDTPHRTFIHMQQYSVLEKRHRYSIPFIYVPSAKRFLKIFIKKFSGRSFSRPQAMFLGFSTTEISRGLLDCQVWQPKNRQSKSKTVPSRVEKSVNTADQRKLVPRMKWPREFFDLVIITVSYRLYNRAFLWIDNAKFGGLKIS